MKVTERRCAEMCIDIAKLPSAFVKPPLTEPETLLEICGSAIVLEAQVFVVSSFGV